MNDIWKADDFLPEIDAERCLLLNEPPCCPHCGGVAIRSAAHRHV